MITHLRSYPTMKNSGIEWLGNVPEHWEVATFRSIGSTEKGRQPRQLMGLDGQESGLPYLSMNFLRDSHADALEYAAPEPGLVTARKGDMLLLWDGANAGEFLRAKEGVVSSTSALIHLYNVQSDYFSYASTIMEPTLRALTIGMGIPHVSGNVLKNLRLPLPSLFEQNAIVRYLDYVDRRVQRLTQAKRRLVALLTEQRQAIIHCAVTRGLDLNAPMKDSGVGWLKEVPKHWKMERTKLVFLRIVGGSTPSSDEPHYWGKDHVWVTPTDISRTTRIQDSQRRLTQAGLDSCSAELLPSGNIVISSRAPVGNVALVEVPFCTNQGCKALILRSDRINPFFALYLFGILKAELQNLANGTTFTEISTQSLGNVRIQLPPIFEQTTIVEYLDQATADIDAAIARANREIELLDEYRTRLIADVVTGKLDVREAAAALPEVDPLEMKEESL